MATPHVAGVAALYLQNNPSASPATVASQIINTSTTGRLTGIGTGSPNRLLYSLLTTGGGGGGVPAACTGGTLYTGTLSFTGDFDYHPNGSYYFSSVSGTHKGCLVGPTSGADFDLYLQKWNGSVVDHRRGLGERHLERDHLLHGHVRLLPLADLFVQRFREL